MERMSIRTRSRWRGLLLPVLVAAGAHAAFAMSIRESKTQIARAPDGATLFEVRGHGPEGGGSLGYRVQGKAPADRVDFVLSSDFSPGGSSRPQTVSPAACEQRLGALAAALAKHKFTGVTVHPEACRAEPRSGLVVAK
jgi:hypothetical protein